MWQHRVNGRMSLVEMEMDLKEDEEVLSNELTVEQMLPLIGGYGMFQKLLVVGLAGILFATGTQCVLGTFITLTRTWECVRNSTECSWNGTFPGKDERRCNISRNEWKYTEEEYFSVVTQFELDCERRSVITLLMSIFFVGWGIGAIVSGSVADRYGRRVTFIPSIATIFILGFASPFVNNVYIIVVFRFFIGFAFPALPILRSVLITEFVGGSVRHIAVSLSSCMANLSWVILEVNAYYV